MSSKEDFSRRFKSQFELEEAVLKHWEENNIFHKSQEQTKDGDIFSFYDGPPFITGIPHYATLLPSIAKDIIPRYQTMKGKSVRRIWGWDTHGLPAETQVEKKLGLKTKKDVEEFGVANFVEENRKYVSDVSGQWQWYIEHIGRWAELDKAYRTDQLSYMESVIWAFKELYKKDLIYKGRRVSLFCTRCATPLSKFEITMDEGNYKDVEDPAVTVAFKLKDSDAHLLAWTTTPWTLPANLALAVDPKAEYVKVSDGKKSYIMAHEAMERYQEGSLRVVEYIKGKELVGQEYEPLYDFFKDSNTNDYKIYAGDFVAMDSGTGIVHIAPGFGEDDTRLGEESGLSTFLTIDDEGHFLPEVKTWAGKFYRQANKPITEDLRNRDLLFKEEKVMHSYPHCYRCGTPLIYKSQVSWYLKVDSLRKDLLAKNKDLNWHPGHFGSGRFQHNLKTAPDWSLSRTRYWGTPLPVWETEDGKETYVTGSVEEIEELSGKKVTDLHRPAINEIELTLPSGKKAKRVKEVLDVWFESGSMPYAQDHYPFNNKELFQKHHPADFIVEYTGQLRGWFYYLHTLSNALFDKNAFKNVVVTGVLMGTDGRKMSKSYGNYPDPKQTIEKFGAESLRLYFMTSKIMNGEDIAISEDEIKDESRLLGVLQNSLQYFLTYSGLHKWKKPETGPELTLLDKWILARVKQLEYKIDSSLSAYDFVGATTEIRPFVEDLSTWFIRRSRDRFVAGDKAALFTLNTALERFSIAAAPILPFSAERIYQALNGKGESVHLEKYPKAEEQKDQSVFEVMSEVREICSVGNMLRAQEQISLRQPLNKLFIEGKTEVSNSEGYQQIIIEELNIKKLTFGAPAKDAKIVEARVGDNMVSLDVHIDDELREEGRLREIMRKLQDARKKAGLSVGQEVVLEYQTDDKESEAIIKKHDSLIKTNGAFSAVKEAEDKTDMTDLPGEDIKFSFVRN